MVKLTKVPNLNDPYALDYLETPLSYAEDIYYTNSVWQPKSAIPEAELEGFPADLGLSWTTQ